jgi:hypothetical protein
MEGVVLPDGAPERLMSAIDSYPAEAKASMLQDLEQGKPLELEAMHGTVVRLGEAFGVPTPVNRLIYAALKLRAGGSNFGLRPRLIPSVTLFPSVTLNSDNCPPLNSCRCYT